MSESFYWLAIPTVFIGLLVIAAAITEFTARWVHTPFRQAEKRRKANEKFKELING